MALPTTRAELASYVKRTLGYPVITINVSDDQVDDRIDEALKFYQEYHFDGSERLFLKHQLTASNLIMTGATTGTFANNEQMRGTTSNVVAKVHTQANTTMVQSTYSNSNVAFTVGETLVGQSSGATAVLGSIQLGDIDNQYLPIANNIMSISKILPFNTGIGASLGADSLFSFEYQYMFNNMASLTTGSVVSYYLTKSHMEMLADLFNGTPDIRFNRHVGRLHIDLAWLTDTHVGMYIVVEAWRLLDPASWPKIWADRFVREYTTALVKRQWGSNLLKYDGVQMPGGVSLNGQKIYDEGNRQVEALEKDIQLKYEMPPMFFVG